MIPLAALKQELKKAKYQTLATAQEKFDSLPVPEHDALGNIEGDAKLDLYTMGLKGNIEGRMQLKLEEYPSPDSTEHVLAKAIQKAFSEHNLNSDVFRINLGNDDVKGMFEGAQVLGLLTADEVTKIKELATYTQNAEFEGVTLEAVEYCLTSPALIETAAIQRNNAKLSLKLNAKAFNPNEPERVDIWLRQAENKDEIETAQYKRVSIETVSEEGLYVQIYERVSLPWVQFKVTSDFNNVTGFEVKNL